MAANFDDIYSELIKKVIQLAETSLNQYLDAAKTDGQTLLQEMKDNLRIWTSQLTAGTITKADFQFLVQSQQDSVEMEALKQAGLSKIKLDEFEKNVLTIIVDTVFSVLKL